MNESEIADILLSRRAELTGCLRAFARDRCLAEDLFQDVCVAAIRRHGEFDDETHLVRWFHVAGKNRAIDHFRKQKKQHLLLDESVLERLAVEAPVTGARSPELCALDTCLGTLTPRSRRLLSLRYGDELSGIEVARHLNQKVDTIYKALARIYAHLRRCVEERVTTAS